MSPRRAAVTMESMVGPKTFGSPHLPGDAAAAVFERILCGVDGSEDGLEAVRQAVRLLAPEGELVLGSVFEAHLAVHAGVHAREAQRELEAAAVAALEGAQTLAPRAAKRLVRGSPAAALLTLAAEEGAGLVAVGAHGFGRAAGIVLGSISTRLLHDAPCSVLVARAPADGAAFPRAIGAGTDGSPESLAAAAAAADLGERLGSSVRYVVATGGKPIDVHRLAASGSELEFTDRSPVDALVEASGSADLVVVGSRGLHGLRALGSVSERVAHRARCSVLVVR